MRLQNGSRRDSFVLTELTNFVYDFYKHANKVLLHVVDQERGWETGGLADKYNGTRDCPSRVTIWITRDRAFPCSNTFEGFTSHLRSWDEEFVLVLAHELRHIDQFHTKVPRLYERDAERYAIKVLRAYKSHKAERKRAA